MPLQDEMMFQRIEVLLDMQAKKVNAELTKLREELSLVKEELRKEIHALRQDPSLQQAGNAHVQMYADAPQQTQSQQAVPRYAQEGFQQQYAQPQGFPRQGYAQPQGFAQQYPQGQPVQQQATQAGAWNQPYPPQMRGGDKAPETKPIDRNGVAPSEVSVEKFFYMGNKKEVTDVMDNDSNQLLVGKDYAGQRWIIVQKSSTLALAYEQDGTQLEFPIITPTTVDSIISSALKVKINETTNAETMTAIEVVYEPLDLARAREYDLPAETVTFSRKTDDKNEYILELNYGFATKVLILARNAQQRWVIISSSGEHHPVLGIYDDNNTESPLSVYTSAKELEGKKVCLAQNRQKFLTPYVKKVFQAADIRDSGCARQLAH